MATPDEAPVRRFRVALDLFEAGPRMMRARLRREHLDWSLSQLEAMLREVAG